MNKIYLPVRDKYELAFRAQPFDCALTIQLAMRPLEADAPKRANILQFELRDQHTIRMPMRSFTDSIPVLAVFKPLKRTRNLETGAIIMHIAHDDLIFGVDPFLLGQMDPLAHSTTDIFPLDVS